MSGSLSLTNVHAHVFMLERCVCRYYITQKTAVQPPTDHSLPTPTTQQLSTTTNHPTHNALDIGAGPELEPKLGEGLPVLAGLLEAQLLLPHDVVFLPHALQRQRHVPDAVQGAVFCGGVVVWGGGSVLVGGCGAGE